MIEDAGVEHLGEAVDAVEISADCKVSNGQSTIRKILMVL